jgi:ribosomal protein RSM22 (predicted rRNA methylase)
LSADRVDQALIKAAAELSYRAPKEYASFVSALVAFVERRKDDVIASPPEVLQVNQGQARACVQLRDLIAEAPRTAQAIIAKQAQRPSSPRLP